MILRSLLMLLFTIGIVNTSLAQESAVREVYVERDVDETSIDRLTFIDVLSGQTSQVEVYGERYTLVSDMLIFYDAINHRIMQVAPDERPEPHPFITLDDTVRRVDWIVSDNRKFIAWTLTSGTDSSYLTTVTYVAGVDGTDIQEIFLDGPRNGVRALPVAFSPDNRMLFMDAHPDGLGRFTAYPQYAGLFSVDLETGQVLSLPGEPGCFCGAGIAGGMFLRLVLNSDASGFDVRAYDLAAEINQIIPATRLRNYTQAGDILIAPDRSKAVYALSQIEGFGTINQSLETVFMLVDLTNLTQSTINAPLMLYLRPHRFTEDNTALLLTSPQQNGTWKMSFENGRLTQVADATVIGILDSRDRR